MKPASLYLTGAVLLFVAGTAFFFSRASSPHAVCDEELCFERVTFGGHNKIHIFMTEDALEPMVVLIDRDSRQVNDNQQFTLWGSEAKAFFADKVSVPLWTDAVIVGPDREALVSYHRIPETTLKITGTKPFDLPKTGERHLWKGEVLLP